MLRNRDVLNIKVLSNKHFNAVSDDLRVL